MKRYCLVEIVDDSLAGNLMCLTSIASYSKNLSLANICLIISKTNPFIPYYQKLNAQLLFSDEYEEIFSNVNSFQWPKQAYFRFLIFKLEWFKQYDFIVYADIDTICKENINDDVEHFSNNLKLIGCVPELHCQFLKSNAILKQTCAKLNLKFTMKTEYCNSGMMYIPNCMLHDQNICNILFNALQFTDHFKTVDQDIINALIGDKIEYLNPIYNLHPGTLRIEMKDYILKHAKVIHHAAVTKSQKFKNMLSIFLANSDYFLNSFK